MIFKKNDGNMFTLLMHDRTQYSKSWVPIIGAEGPNWKILRDFKLSVKMKGTQERYHERGSRNVFGSHFPRPEPLKTG